MNDSLYLLPYRLLELKPDALDALKDRVYSATAPIQDSTLLYNFCPYARYALAPLITLSIIVLPILALLAVPVTLFVGSDAMVGYVSTVVSSPVYLAGIFAGAYSLSLHRYWPTDKQDYLTVSTPTSYEAWESLFTTMVYAVIPTLYFSLLYFEELAGVIPVTKLSAFILSWIGFILAFIPLYYWMDHRYGRDRNVKPQMAALWGGVMIQAPIIALYLAQVAFEFELLVYGTGVGAVFTVHLVWMVFILRNLRRAMYEDWAGFDLSPRFPLWGLISRVPFAFALAVIILTDDLTRIAVIASFSPLIGSITYIGWRAWVTGDLKKPPRGWSSSPGRKQYENTRRSNEKKSARTEEVRQAIVEFNKFASTHGLSTLSEPDGLMMSNVETIRDELKEIHEYEARELTGDTYSDYMSLRNNLRNLL